MQNAGTPATSSALMNEEEEEDRVIAIRLKEAVAAIHRICLEVCRSICRAHG